MAKIVKTIKKIVVIRQINANLRRVELIKNNLRRAEHFH